MLAYRPNFYPDELLYSYVARYKEHSLLSVRKAFKLLFFTENRSLDLLFPNKISSIAKVLSIDAKGLLHSHTLFPIVSNFGTTSEVKIICDKMMTGEANWVANYFGSRLEKFKYCSLCIKSDVQKFGEPYWHRCHNLPFFNTCVHHGSNLEVWSPEFITSGGSKGLYLAKEVEAINVQPTFGESIICDLERRVFAIINGNDHFSHAEMISMGIRKGIIKEGEQRFQTLDILVKLYNEFVSENYPPLLASFKITRRKLSFILRNRYCIPYYFIVFLLKECLKESPGEIVHIKPHSVVCINRQCSNFQKELIVSNSITITCPQCEMTYQIFIKNGSLKHKIKSYGNLVAAEVRKLYRKIPIIQISKNLKISIKAVNHILITELNVHPAKDLKKQKTMRLKWIKILKEYPDERIQSLCHRFAKVYCWLQANDNAWLLKTNKVNRRKQKITRPIILVDSSLLEKIMKVYENINYENYPKRICTNSLISPIRGIQIQTLKKFPESNRFIKSVVESRMDYIKRKIRNFIRTNCQIKNPNTIFYKLSLPNIKDQGEKAEIRKYIVDQLELASSGQ